MLDEEQISHRIYGTDNTIGLFVSLYLIFLSFFIVLTAMSSRAVDRTLSATESVKAAFAGDGEKKEGKGFSDEPVEPTEDPTLQRIEKVFQATFSLDGRYGKRDGNIFFVDVPEEFLFEPGAALMKDAPAKVIQQLVEAARERRSERRSDVVILQDTPSMKSGAAADRQRRLSYRRAGGLSRLFVNAGIEEGSYSTGFAPIGRGIIRFQFRTLMRSNPALPLGLPENQIDQRPVSVPLQGEEMPTDTETMGAEDGT